LKFLEFCQLIDINKYKSKKITKEELYVDVVCLIFNDFMKNCKNDLLKWEFTIPSFFKDDKFKINTDLIYSSETKDHIKSHEKIEYVFKCILGSFSKKRKKPIGIFNNTTLNLFNELVDKISISIDKYLKINREYSLQKQDLVNFKDYFDLKYNKDIEGDIYPDVYSEYEASPEEKKGKKKEFEDKKGKDSGKDIDQQEDLFNIKNK